MNARNRYQIAFLALGWLILLGVLFQGRVGAALRGGYARAEGSLTQFGQSLSDAESDARQRARGGRTRAAEMALAHPGFSSIENLREPKQTLFRIYDGELPASFSGVEEAEARTAYRFPIISFYQAWGDRPDQAHFPTRVVQTIDRLGSVPLITWEPWVTAFDEELRPNLPPPAEREYASLAAVARGDYDFYVTQWAADAARYGKPIFLRFAHEMNDPYRYPWGPQNGNRPADFIAAWKHVHQIFTKMNATNVLWVWSPHISMPWFEYYYPGDDVVDWIGTGILNYGDVAPWSRWWTFHQIIEKAYPDLTKLAKPIMISEFGTVDSGGDAEEWYRSAFADIGSKYPAIRAVVLFNQKRDVTLSSTPLDWSVTRSRATARTVGDALRSAR